MAERVASDKEIADWIRARFPLRYIVEPSQRHVGSPMIYAQDFPGGDSFIRIRPDPPHLATHRELAAGLQCSVRCHLPAVAIARRGNVWEGRCPYQWSLRLDTDGLLASTWYYAWDCASGVIWRPRNATVTYLGIHEWRQDPAEVTP